MFKKLTKKFGSGTKEKKDPPPAVTAANTTSNTNTVQTASTNTNSTTSSAAAHATATVTPNPASSTSASPTISTTLNKPTPSSSSSPPLSPATPTDSPSPSTSPPETSLDGKVLSKKKSSSRGERKENEAAATSNGVLLNGSNGSRSGSGSSGTTDDVDEDESNAASSSTPHQLTRADLLKPIPSLLDGLPTGSNAAAASPPPSAAQQQLFIHKLRLCCITFDWSKDETANNNPPVAAAASSPTSFAAPTPAPSAVPLNSKDARAKESKRVQLLELLEYIGKAKNLYNDHTLAELMHMIAANLFRALPPRSSELPSDEDEPVYEPSWSHLQIVYELFLRFIVNNDIDVRTLKRHIHASFVLHLLELFDSEDHRERDYLKTILHRIYAKFMSLRAFIRKAMNHVFFIFIYEHDRHNGIAELLEILGSIINGFALPLKHEHKLFLKKVLIPMHKVRTLHHFHQQLSYCVSQFVDKDPELSVCVLQGLMRYWPVSNSAKEVLFLNELEQVLELTQPEEFGLLVVPLFKRVALSIASPHFQVAERALFLWHNEYISHLIAQHREDILPLLYPVLAAASHPPLSTLTNGEVREQSDSESPEEAAAGGAEGGGAGTEGRLGGHWNPTVNNLTQNVLKIFVELDAPLVDNVREDGKQKEEQKERTKQERRREWKRLEDEERRVRREGRRTSNNGKPDETHLAPDTNVPALDPAVEAALVTDVHTHQVGDLIPSTALQSPPVLPTASTPSLAPPPASAFTSTPTSTSPSAS